MGVIMKIKKYAILIGLMANLQSSAQPFNGSHLTEIQTANGPKTISLMKLDPNVMFNWADAAPELDYSKGIVSFEKSPSAVFLVPSVPVLDQGSYGTCVTFAASAAMDAVLELGDAISQQCSLELDDALGSSLWDGAWMSSEVIDPLKKYGAVHQGRCGSHSYPDRNAKVSLEDYKKLVDPSISVSKVQYAYHEPFKVDDIKAAIAAHHYVNVGFGLLASSTIGVQGFDVVVDGKKKSGGLWACKQPSDKANYCGQSHAGHEVLIVGYDDNQRLFKIQNSWNVGAGDSGFFYMSYEFLSVMELNGTEVWSP